MNKRQVLLTVISICLLALVALAGQRPAPEKAAAAPADRFMLIQNPPDVSRYISLSGLAFMPVNPAASYQKDVRRQLLSLPPLGRSFPAEENVFTAPLVLPDQAQLAGLTVFGEDFDNQGAIQLRLKRCDHGQARCLNIVETTSTDIYAAGQFETARITPLNEVIDNNLYSYFLELELTALANSGLRSVRLELGGNGSLPPAGNVERWSLAGNVTNFIIPTVGWAQVRVCTDDLSHLNNVTHYPQLIADGQAQTLGSKSCVTVTGRDIELRRPLNTGPSAGTYQILR